MRRFPMHPGATALATALALLAAGPALAQGSGQTVCERDEAVCPQDKALSGERDETPHPPPGKEILDRKAYDQTVEDRPGLFDAEEDQAGIPDGGPPAKDPPPGQPDIWGREGDDGWLD